MKTFVHYFSSLLDSLGILSLLIAAGCLIYAIKIPELSLAEQYFSNFFAFLLGAVSLFIVSRISQFALLLVEHGMQNTAKADANVYRTAKPLR